MECDDYTKKYMRDNAEIFRDADCSEVIERIRIFGNNFESLEKYLIEIVRKFDPHGKGWVLVILF